MKDNQIVPKTELVTVDSTNHLTTNSYIISKKFQVRHGALVKTIVKIGECKDIVSTTLTTDRGRKVNGYLLSQYGVDMIEKRKGIKKQPSTKLYVVSMESTTYIKVGITNNIEKRLQTLQNANPLKLNIEFVSEFKDVKKLETLIHKTFKQKRMMGEWFDISHTEVVRFIKGLAWN